MAHFLVLLYVKIIANFDFLIYVTFLYFKTHCFLAFLYKIICKLVDFLFFFGLFYMKLYQKTLNFTSMNPFYPPICHFKHYFSPLLPMKIHFYKKYSL
jgi:hypothetical protein